LSKSMTELLDTFSDLEDLDIDEYYPGSKMRRRESREARQKRVREEREARKAAASWDANPRKYTINGHTMDFYPVGALAKALNRDSVTIRAWIRKGWLPKARYQTPKIYGSRGDAARRLWTHDQIAMIVRIAKEEGVLEGKFEKMDDTDFVRRVAIEFKAIR
jgi:hypothetical protein